MKSFLLYSLIFLSSLWLTSCWSYEKEVDIKLPEKPKQLVVECYLEQGKTVKVAVSETQNYFGTYQLPSVNDARVTLSYEGHTDTIRPGFALQDFINDQKYYNYVLNKPIQLKTGVTYHLEVHAADGRSVTAETHWLDPVPVDTFFFYRNDTNYNVTIYFWDPVGSTDYYRFHAYDVNDTARHEKADYFFDDRLIQGMHTPRGTSYRLHRNDSVRVTLYHIPKEYYDFLNSVFAAEQASSNPFAEPAAIQSNIQGGIGIFTTLPYSRKKLKVE